MEARIAPLQHDYHLVCGRCKSCPRSQRESCGSFLFAGLKTILGTIFRRLLCLSFGVMIAIGALMAYGLVPAIRGGQASELIAWETFVHPRQEGVLGKLFFSLSAVNLVLIWGWLIHCAARLDFLRLFAGPSQELRS